MATRLGRGVALVVALTAVSATPAAAAQPIFGYNDRAVVFGPHQKEAVHLARETGARAYRFSLEWAAVEARPGVWTWTNYDATYDKIVKAGLRPVIILRSAPRWAQDNWVTSCVAATLFGGCGRPPARTQLAAWAEFARRAAKRYPEALGLEIFNEPNLASNWQPIADPAYYARVLRVARDAVKEVRPSMPVISGGIPPITESGGSMDADRFLTRFYAAGGRGAMDAIGIHPYSFPLGPSADGSYYHRFMNEMRKIRDDAGDSRTPFWITEFGYHTGPAQLGGVPPYVQASFVPGVIRLALNEPDVEVALLHSLVDFGTDSSILGNDFGLLDTKLNKKPAFGEVVRAVPPSVAITSAPASIRSSCPKRRRGRPACKRGGSVKVRVWKSSTVSVSVTARKRRGLKLRQQVDPGSATLKISGRVRGKAMRPGRYNLTVLATDRYGNQSDRLQRKIRIR